MPYKSFILQSQFFKLFGIQPELGSFKVFGTTVNPYLRPHNSYKLEPRIYQCVFLGYSLGYKGVICFHRGKQRLFISSHVIHDETLFPFHTKPIVQSLQRGSNLPITIILLFLLLYLNHMIIPGILVPSFIGSSTQHSYSSYSSGGS